MSFPIGGQNTVVNTTHVLKTRSLGFGIWVAVNSAKAPSLCVRSYRKNRPTKQGKDGYRKELRMLGWTILFGLMSLGGVLFTLAGHPAQFCLKTATFIFAMLFLLSLVARAVRGRAH